MTCQDAREQLSALLDEALEADRRVELDAHLAGCAECRFELDRLRATVVALRGLERPRAPVGFVDRVVGHVHSVPWYRRLGAWLFLPLSVKLPAEAAAVVIVGGLAMLVWERTPEFRSAARQDYATPSAPPTARLEPVPPMPSQSMPAPPVATPPLKPPRERSEEPPRPSPAPTETETPPASTEAKPPAPPEWVEKIAAPPVPRAKAAAPPASEGKVAGFLTPEARIESEIRAEALPQPLAPPQPLARPAPPAGQSDRSEFRARSAPQTVRRTLGAVASSDLAGRLIVRDRDAAAVALLELLGRLGGHEIGRRRDADDTVIEVQIPAARYDEFVRALAALGSWTTAGRPNVLPLEPPQIRMTIRLSG